MTTATDLVAANVLLGIAKRVRQTAFVIAQGKNVPIRSIGEIVIDPPTITQNQVAINIRFSNNRIAAYEWGSGVHRKRGTPGKYPIVAKNTRNLVFWWEREQTMFFGPRVDHPGVKARPFLDPAKNQTRQKNLEDIRKTYLANLRLIIKGMAKTI